ncbi:MAG: response regulator [Halieaceae bacterium]|jgi:DNA-binding NtrC family response regulator|nr:response regulator [Halieaceae bacterium]
MRPNPRIPTRSVLVVDDDQDLLEEVSETLSDEGYLVMSAQGVDAALEVLRNHADIQVIVTDILMPDKSGISLIQESRAEFKRNLNYIIMSGHLNPATKSLRVDDDKISFLGKPLDIDQFLSSVERAFRRDNPGA